MIEIDELSIVSRHTVNNDIEGCELAVTDKAKCIMCKRGIARGTPRTWVMGEMKQPPPDEGISKIKRFVCHSCSKRLFKLREKNCLRDIKEGENAKKKLEAINVIKDKYSEYLKDSKIMNKVKNDEIVRELEKTFDE